MFCTALLSTLNVSSTSKLRLFTFVSLSLSPWDDVRKTFLRNWIMQMKAMIKVKPKKATRRNWMLISLMG